VLSGKQSGRHGAREWATRIWAHPRRRGAAGRGAPRRCTAPSAHPRLARSTPSRPGRRSVTDPDRCVMAS
jgi:hypothetical protein